MSPAPDVGVRRFSSTSLLIGFLVDRRSFDRRTGTADGRTVAVKCRLERLLSACVKHGFTIARLQPLQNKNELRSQEPPALLRLQQTLLLRAAAERSNIIFCGVGRANLPGLEVSHEP